jgi:hypothetical protein
MQTFNWKTFGSYEDKFTPDGNYAGNKMIQGDFHAKHTSSDGSILGPDLSEGPKFAIPVDIKPKESRIYSLPDDSSNNTTEPTI